MMPLLNAVGPLPTRKELKPPSRDQLIAICRKSYPDHEWILLENGTCLIKDDSSTSSVHSSLDNLFDNWKKIGPNMDDGVSYPMKDGSGWIVTCGSFRSAVSIILADEVESGTHPLKVTMLGFIKRKADFQNPAILFKYLKKSSHPGFL